MHPDFRCNELLACLLESLGVLRHNKTSWVLFPAAIVSVTVSHALLVPLSVICNVYLTCVKTLKIRCRVHSVTWASLFIWLVLLVAASV